MIRALRDFSRTGTLTGTQATKDALVSMRYLRATLRENEAVFDYAITVRGKDLLQTVPEELTEEKPVRVSLPVITCVPGCGDCCGPVPITAMELHRLKAYVEKHQVVPKYTGHLTCPFFQEGSCKVHVVRPLLCQLFGHTRKMKCPKGRNRFVPEKIIHQMMIENGTAVGTIPQFFKAIPDGQQDSHTQEQTPQPDPQA
jgi:Fe-S-cluster containining protein